MATTSPFYGFIRSLACKGIISGYSDNTFRPFNNVTRGQAAKIVTLAAGFNDDITPGQQSFKDVAPTSPFWLFVERAKLHGTISGYNDPTTCNGADNAPCFRPELNMTRGQIAKVVANARGLNQAIPAGQQTFQDVNPTNPFYNEIERVVGQGIISGYNCGVAPAGDCVTPDNKPYFLWGNQVTRGQTAKIVGGAFYPNGE